MRRILPLCLLSHSLGLICSTASLAGVVFEVETREFGFSPPRTEMSTIYAEALSLKMETGQQGSGKTDEMIFRGDRREMVVVDHTNRSYMVIDKQFVSNMMGQLQQMAGQMQGVLDSVPPEQRALVDQMMKNPQSRGQLPARPKPEVRSTGRRATVYGYPCVLVTISRQGRKERDVWVTDWNNIKGSRELAATFDSMSDFTQELISAIPMQGQSPMRENAFMTIRQMGGFPVATREYREDGTLESETALRSARRLSINPSVFAPPAGYQADSMFGGPALGRSPSNASRYGQSRR